MIMEMSAAELEGRARNFVSLKTKDMLGAFGLLRKNYNDVRTEEGYIRIYGIDDVEAVVALLIENGYIVSEIKKNKIGLEEYYIELMSKKEEV